MADFFVCILQYYYRLFFLTQTLCTKGRIIVPTFWCICSILLLFSMQKMPSSTCNNLLLWRYCHKCAAPSVPSQKRRNNFSNNVIGVDRGKLMRLLSFARRRWQIQGVCVKYNCGCFFGTPCETMALFMWHKVVQTMAATRVSASDARRPPTLLLSRALTPYDFYNSTDNFVSTSFLPFFIHLEMNLI